MSISRHPLLVSMALAGGALALMGSGISCDVEEGLPTAPERVTAAPQAFKIDTPAQLIGGPAATGRVGDYMLQNDHIRVIIRDVDRTVSAAMFGGHIIDADVRRPVGEPGRDQFGQLSTFVNLSNSLFAEEIRVLPTSELPANTAGIEACGKLDLFDFIDMGAALSFAPAGTRLVRWDFNEVLDLEVCNIFLLGANDHYVQVSTDLTNPDSKPVLTAVGDLIDTGSDVELFTPNEPGSGFGKIETRYTWGGFGPQPFALTDLIGFFGKDVAYGYITIPEKRGEPDMQAVSVAGVTATVIGSTSLLGTFTHRPKEMFRIPPRSTRRFTRYFAVGARDLADVTDSAFPLWGDTVGYVTGQVTDSATGAPVPNVRITALVNGGSGRPLTQFYADETGHFEGSLPEGRYGLIAADGWQNTESARPTVTTPMTIEVAKGQTSTHNFQMAPGAEAVVNVYDGNKPTGNHLPARLTFYGTDPSPIPPTIMDVGDDPFRPGVVQEVTITEANQKVPIRPGRYDVVMTRGPEYDRVLIQDVTFPAGGSVPLQGILTRVVDTTGYVSADVHVHAMNSPDSPIGNVPRVKAFMADGVDVLVSTDHDFITDFRPIIDDLDASRWLTSLPGLELTTFAVGHYNAFPLNVDPDHRLGGALDWADNAYLPINPDTGDVVDVDQNTELPSWKDNLSPVQFLQALELGYEGKQVRQLNHARGALQGYFTSIGLDLSKLGTSGETQAEAETFRMPPGSDLFDPTTFEAFEVLNGFDNDRAYTLFNDAFSLFNQGYPKVMTAVSDTHYLVKMTSGIGRTWVEIGEDDTAALHEDPTFGATFAQAFHDGKATASNGAFLTARVQREGQPQSAVGPGGMLSALTGDVEIVFDIQSPLWITYQNVGIFVNAPSRGNFDSDAFHGMDQLNAEAVFVSGRDFVPGIVQVDTSNPAGARRRETTKSIPLHLDEDAWIVVALWGGDVEMGGADSWESLAFTSPIRVDVDGDGWQAPCTPGQSCDIIGSAREAWEPKKITPADHHGQDILALDEILKMELAGLRAEPQ